MADLDVSALAEKLLAAAYLAANGWARERDGRGGSLWRRDGERLFLPERTDYVDWDKRMAELVRDLADAHGTGEFGLLAAIEATHG